MDKKIKVKYALEFAKLSYSLEEKRDQYFKECREINPLVLNYFCYRIL
jgi:hypothetical protein